VNTHTPVVLLLLTSLLATASASPNTAAERSKFRVNRAKWDQRGITSYEYRLRDETCFCLHALGYGPFRVIIDHGKVAKAIYEGERRDGYWPGRVIPKKTYEKTNLIATVEEVFARAEHVINSPEHAPYTISYDPKYGFPTLIDVDNSPHIADAQWRLVVDRFRPK
jgi:hypothetical protein